VALSDVLDQPVLVAPKPIHPWIKAKSRSGPGLAAGRWRGMANSAHVGLPAAVILRTWPCAGVPWRVFRAACAPSRLCAPPTPHATRRPADPDG